ncbi:MAG TPA: cupredoxin domain-containing protein [Methanobacterium sp.]|nr:cupredoxin domain-containing protein [Methanobacterium sp.]
MYRNRGILALIIIIIVIIIAAAAAYFYSTQSSNSQTGVNNGSNNASNMSNGTSAVSVIIIQNGAFNPNSLTIKTGTNVQWTNRDNTTHQVISDSGAFQSPVLNPGDSYNFYFAKSGVFGYHCGIHSTETGTIIVQG